MHSSAFKVPTYVILAQSNPISIISAYVVSWYKFFATTEAIYQKPEKLGLGKLCATPIMDDRARHRPWTAFNFQLMQTDACKKEFAYV